MASYVVSFPTISSSLTDWKVIPLDDSDATYCNPSLGHVGVDISGIDVNSAEGITIGVAWADCDTKKANAILGVTKYAEYFGDVAGRRTGLNNASGDYVVESILESVISLPPPIRSLGVGPAIDRRSSPRTGIKRIMLVGIVNADILFPFGITLIVTPTRII